MAREGLQPVEESGQLLVISSRQVMLVVTSVVLVTSMLIFMLSAIGGVRYTLTRPNPLAHYGSLLPGQAASILARYGCQKVTDADSQNTRLSVSSACAIFPRDEVFHLIQVTADESQITEVRLFSDILQPEWLFASWGQPDTMLRTENRQAVTLRWDRGQYTASVTVRQADHVARLITLNAKI